MYLPQAISCSRVADPQPARPAAGRSGVRGALRGPPHRPRRLNRGASAQAHRRAPAGDDHTGHLARGSRALRPTLPSPNRSRPRARQPREHRSTAHRSAALRPRRRRRHATRWPPQDLRPDPRRAPINATVRLRVRTRPYRSGHPARPRRIRRAPPSPTTTQRLRTRAQTTPRPLPRSITTKRPSNRGQ